jgi:hypothetical protein
MYGMYGCMIYDALKVVNYNAANNAMTPINTRTVASIHHRDFFKQYLTRYKICKSNRHLCHTSITQPQFDHQQVQS